MKRMVESVGKEQLQRSKSNSGINRKQWKPVTTDLKFIKKKLKKNFKINKSVKRA